MSYLPIGMSILRRNEHIIKMRAYLADINVMRTAGEDRTGLTAFSLIELLVIILIVSILAGLLVPIIRGRIESAKWAEANAAAGMIRNAVKIYYFESGAEITGSLGDVSILNALSIGVGDLTGTYFVASDYTIDSVNSEGIATITVTGSLPKAPKDSKTLYPNGEWE